MVMKHVVLITGGAGFLGQHLVKYIEEHCGNEYEEIRIADKRAFRQFLDYARPIPIVEFTVDCSVFDELSSVVCGCTAVFNLCGRPLPLTVYKDSDLQFRDNYKTVEILIRAVLFHNVPYLIHVSDGLCGSLQYGHPGFSETASDDIPEDSPFWFEDYGAAKYQGEKLVRNSNGLTCIDGVTILKCLAVRPCVIYGEGDTLIVPHLIRLCDYYGSLVQFGARESKLDFVYAGNVAYMLHLSLQKLVQNPEVFGGEMFFCNEDTVDEFYSFYEPIIEAMGYRVTNWCVNSTVADILSFAWERFFRFLNLFHVQFAHNLPTQGIVKAVSGMYITYETTKLRHLMKYQPVYDQTESKRNTVEWCQNVKKTN